MTLRKAAARWLYSPAEERAQNKLKTCRRATRQGGLSYAYCVNYHFFVSDFFTSYPLAVPGLGQWSRGGLSRIVQRFKQPLRSFLRSGLRANRVQSGRCALSSPACRLPCSALAPSRRRSSAASRSRRWWGSLSRPRLARRALLLCCAAGLLVGLCLSSP